MIESEDGARSAGISTGDIRGVGIVVGHGSSASVAPAQPQAQLELVAMLDKFLDLLERCEASISDASSVRESAIEVKSEIGKPSPKWGLVRVLLRGISASVASVDSLVETVNNIQVLVSHSFK
jgi:hypothetical protein